MSITFLMPIAMGRSFVTRKKKLHFRPSRFFSVFPALYYFFPHYGLNSFQCCHFIRKLKLFLQTTRLNYGTSFSMNDMLYKLGHKVWKNSAYTNVSPPHSCAILTKHFHLTQVFILPFSKLHWNEGGKVLTLILYCRYHNTVIISWFFCAFQHNLSTVVALRHDADMRIGERVHEDLKTKNIHRISSNNSRGRLLLYFRTKRGRLFEARRLFEGGDYFKYFSQEVVP